MKWALSLMLIGSVLAKNLPANHGETRLPIQKQQFELTYYDLRKTLIDEIFDEKINDGQLSNAPLTLQEIQKVRESFQESIEGLYHQRVLYPEITESDFSEEE